MTTPWIPRRGDIVSYGKWRCVVPFDADPEDTQIDIMRLPQKTWTPDVHISRLKLVDHIDEAAVEELL